MESERRSARYKENIHKRESERERAGSARKYIHTLVFVGDEDRVHTTTTARQSSTCTRSCARISPPCRAPTKIAHLTPLDPATHHLLLAGWKY